MQYYSSINIYPRNLITTDKNKIRQFNEIVECIQGIKKDLDPESKAIYDKVIKYADKEARKNFTYKLDKNGSLITEEDENVRHTEVIQGIKVYSTHYATMLAKILSEFAEYPIVIEFFLEDLHWGYFIDPKTKDYCYLAPFLIETNGNRIKIYNSTGIQEYILVKEESYSKLAKTKEKKEPDRRLIFG